MFRLSSLNAADINKSNHTFYKKNIINNNYQICLNRQFIFNLFSLKLTKQSFFELVRESFF